MGRRPLFNSCVGFAWEEQVEDLGLLASNLDIGGVFPYSLHDLFLIRLSCVLSHLIKKILPSNAENHQQQAGVGKVTSLPMILLTSFRNGLLSGSQAQGQGKE